MNKDTKQKYEKYKLTVKLWEYEFKKKNDRIPSKYDIRDAPLEVKQAYKMYYKIKTSFLSQSMNDFLGEDDDDEDQNNDTVSTINFSDSINELLDTSKKLEFEAVGTVTRNENAWNSSLSVPKAKVENSTKKSLNFGRKTNEKTKLELSLKSATFKAPRNPRKVLAKTKSSSQLPNDDNNPNDLPDLETILLEKSRATKVFEATKSEVPAESEIKTSVDSNWLNRNLDSTDNETICNLTATSSFGLSNLVIAQPCSSLQIDETPTDKSVEVKFHSCDISDNEYVTGTESKKEILPISKKRKISEFKDGMETTSINPPDNSGISLQQSTSNQAVKRLTTGTRYNTDDDDDEDIKNQSLSPKDMKRKKSLIKRSKDGITKLLSRGKKNIKVVEEVNQDFEKEDEINYFIDTEFKNIKSVPRMSEKFLDQSEKLIQHFVDSQGEQIEPNNQSTKSVIDHKTTQKKEALNKKISTGTLNENYVRVNLKKKVFVRGKKAFSLSRYKKSIWKSKKQARDLNDMRGCDGGVLKCFNCGGVGHFAQQCKKKGDNLLPADVEIEEESTLPTLEEASQMADKQKMLSHANKPTSIPFNANYAWRDEKSDNLNKENKDLNGDAFVEEKKSYIGHKIPQNFLEMSGILEMSAGSESVQPYYSSLSDQTSKEVLAALKLFGHKQFRNGQAQAIHRILCGKSTLVTLSTGSGKSLCYQLPAYLYSKKSRCITLVISPLVSLMEDQVHGIPDFINAQCLHTNQTPKQRDKVMEELKNGQVNILLVSPEAVVSGENSTGFGSLLRQLPPIAFACIDEAHCVSQWSHNFRPSYLMVCRVLREKLGVKTVLGLTATATIQTRESIVKHLDIPDGLNGIISDTPLPDNLILTISRDENRDKALIGLLRSERFESLISIIIYCTRREECERIAAFLRTCLQDAQKDSIQATEKSSKKRKRNNWLAEAYHAGLPASRRRTIQNAFMCGDLKIVVATIAFGMGINKSDIRGIIHYNMPRSFESYVQEVGRAGRDGKLAQCHVFLDSKGSDLSEIRRHIYSNSIDRHVIRKLLQKVFVPCACKQRESLNDGEKMNISSEKVSRVCKSHEVSFSIEQTVQLLDIPQENIATLLCYLELHEERYIKVMGNAYTMCKIISYSGSKHIKQVAKSCPPLAMAIALELKGGKQEDDLNSIEFCVVNVASAMGWDSGVVKYQLKQLEWIIGTNGSKKRSPLSVTFSDLGFRIKSPGDLNDEELDHALDSLEKRTSSQEVAQLIQLQIICDTLVSLAMPNYMHCSINDKLPINKSDELKSVIRNYFQTSLPMNVEISDEADNTLDSEIIGDIRQLISMYPENNFSGRAISRIFHGISSPCYPAVIWGRCKFWRAHLSVSFHRIVKIANNELVKNRANS